MQIFAFTLNDLYVEAFDTHMVTVAFTTYSDSGSRLPQNSPFKRTKLMLFPDRSNSGLSLEKVYNEKGVCHSFSGHFSLSTKTEVHILK